MQASDKTPGRTAAGQAAQTPGTAGSNDPGKKTAGRPGVQRARRAAEWGQEKYAGSSAEYLWHRLNSVDFINQGIIFGATLLLWLGALLLVGGALAGRSAASGL